MPSRVIRSRQSAASRAVIDPVHNASHSAATADCSNANTANPAASNIAFNRSTITNTATAA